MRWMMLVEEKEKKKKNVTKSSSCALPQEFLPSQRSSLWKCECVHIVTIFTSFFTPMSSPRKHLIVHLPRSGNNKGSFSPTTPSFTFPSSFSTLTSFYYFHLLKYAIYNHYGNEIASCGVGWKKKNEREIKGNWYVAHTWAAVDKKSVGGLLNLMIAICDEMKNSPRSVMIKTRNNVLSSNKCSLVVNIKCFKKIKSKKNQWEILIKNCMQLRAF